MSEDTRDLVSIIKPLDRESDWQIGTELTNEELELIGLITANWAYLEHALFIRSLMMAQENQIKPPEDISSLIFEKRLKSFREINKSTKDAKLKDTNTRLADKITNLKDKRHKITHGLWEWDRDNPDKLSAYSFRPRVDYEYPFDLGRLQKLADGIGEISFLLTYPNGLSDVEMVPGKRRFPGVVIKAEPPSSLSDFGEEEA